MEDEVEDRGNTGPLKVQLIWFKDKLFKRVLYSRSHAEWDDVQVHLWMSVAQAESKFQINSKNSEIVIERTGMIFARVSS